MRSSLRALAIVLTAAGCAKDDTFIVIKLEAATGASFNDVRQVEVVIDSPDVDTLTYPEKPLATPLVITAVENPTLSVSFSPSRSGTFRAMVIAKSATAKVGWGFSEVAIRKGGVARMTVVLAPGEPPDGGLPDRSTDGSPDVRDAGGDARDLGTEAPTACSPTAPATCGAAMTCALSCETKTGACESAGNGQSGAVCGGPGACATGLSCFAYDCATVCAKYCTSDNDCSPGTCATPINCGGPTTLARICTTYCDPRGTATQGCPANMRCGIFENELVDCACATGMGTDGAACKDSSECAAGFHCVEMAGKTCRPICRLDAGDADCAGKICTMLTNYVTFGVCM